MKIVAELLVSASYAGSFIKFIAIFDLEDEHAYLYDSCKIFGASWQYLKSKNF